MNNVWYGILATTIAFVVVMVLACVRGGRHDEPPEHR